MAIHNSKFDPHFMAGVGFLQIAKQGWFPPFAKKAMAGKQGRAPMAPSHSWQGYIPSLNNLEYVPLMCLSSSCT
jgi:hypothetical protein